MKKEYYTEETFNQDKYPKNSWKVYLIKTHLDEGKLRLVVRVATGRKYWPLFSVVPTFELGVEDPVLKEIKFSLNHYTHFMIDRFIKELNVCLSDIYQVDIDLYQIESGIKKENYYSSHNF